MVEAGLAPPLTGELVESTTTVRRDSDPGKLGVGSPTPECGPGLRGDSICVVGEDDRRPDDFPGEAVELFDDLGGMRRIRQLKTRVRPFQPIRRGPTSSPR